MSEETDLLREIAKSAATIYTNMDIDYPLSFVFRRAEIPQLHGSERVRVVIIREHDEPPTHPLFDAVWKVPGAVTP